MLQDEHLEKNNFDLLRRYIGYIIKSTPYKNKTLIGVIYFL